MKSITVYTVSFKKEGDNIPVTQAFLTFEEAKKKSEETGGTFSVHPFRSRQKAAEYVAKIELGL